MSELISIIMPIYNVEKYLAECLDSIMRQTYKNIEVIMVDDGSTDLSGEICDDYQRRDKRFRAIHKKNGGVSSARNAGLEAATGTYIGFVDPDDWIEEQMFEILHQDIKKYKVDIAICAYYETGHGELLKKVIHDQGVVSSEEALDGLLQKLMSYLWCRLYCKEVFDGLRFIEGRNYEDIAIMHRLIMNSNLVYFDDRPLYYYRLKRQGSIVATNTPKNLHDYFLSYLDILHDMKKEKTEFAGRAMKGVVVSYLVQYKRLTVVGKLTDEYIDELKGYKRIIAEELKQLKQLKQKTNLSVKEKGEMIMAMHFPRLFILGCKLYRNIIGRELG